MTKSTNLNVKSFPGPPLAQRGWSSGSAVPIDPVHPPKSILHMGYKREKTRNSCRYILKISATNQCFAGKILSNPNNAGQYKGVP